MSNSTQLCYHCHEPIPPKVDIAVTVQHESHSMCCQGCAAVATMLATANLDDFYTLRTAAAVRPQVRSDAWWRAFDDVGLQHQLAETTDDGIYTMPVNVNNLRCAACVWLLESCISKLAGVEHIAINYVTGQGQLSWRADSIRLSDILLQADKLGYPLQPALLATTPQQRETQRRSLRRMLVAALGMFQVMMMSIGLYLGMGSDMQLVERDFLRWIALILATPVVWYSGWPFFQAAWQQCRALRPGMHVPVSLAILLAWYSSCLNTFAGSGEVYFDSAVMFVFFLSVSGHLEQRARMRAQTISNRAAQSLPLMAKRIDENGKAKIVQAMQLHPGEQVLAATGETLAVDGIILGKTSITVSESLLSGESKPVNKTPGDFVLAGSQIIEGTAHIQVTACGKNTALAAIQRLAHSNQVMHHGIDWVNKIAVWFTLGLLCLAVATAAWYWSAGWQHSLQITLAVLVVSCPCALALAVPSVLAAAQAQLARSGILLRDPSVLFRIPKIEHVLLDKTGTLTQGQFGARRLLTTANLPTEIVKQHMTALANCSHHPIVQSLQNLSSKITATNTTEVIGQGITGHIAGKVYRLGKLDYVATLSSSNRAHLRTKYLSVNDNASSELWLGDEHQVLGVLLLDDLLKPQAAEHIRALQLNTSIASGDTLAAVSKVAKQLDIVDYAATLSPQQKLAYLQQLQSSGCKVLAVGDGINDAPFLAAADVGIAMGTQHSLAKANADVLILHDSLAALPELKVIAITACRRMQQNLGWALIYNISVIPVAMLGYLPPWLAALGMSLSSLLVVGNSLRLTSTKAIDSTSVATSTDSAGLVPQHVQV